MNDYSLVNRDTHWWELNNQETDPDLEALGKRHFGRTVGNTADLSLQPEWFEWNQIFEPHDAPKINGVIPAIREIEGCAL